MMLRLGRVRCPVCGDEGLTVPVNGLDGNWSKDGFKKVAYAQRGIMLTWDERSLAK